MKTKLLLLLSLVVFTGCAAPKAANYSTIPDHQSPYTGNWPEYTKLLNDKTP